jgi:putative acetyltransferase
MEILESQEDDIDSVYQVEKEAFGTEIEANLTMDLMKDISAKPYLSLIAIEEEETIGHALFTKGKLDPERSDVFISILGPLAVHPDYQKIGVGKKLVKTGLDVLKERGIDLVFVSGHPNYYPKFGFSPAGKNGFDAPYPIPDAQADAWMVLELKPGLIGNISGTILCAEALDKPEFWID